MQSAGLKGCESTGWYGLYAPARTPHPVIVKLHESVRAAVHTPDLRERFANAGIQPLASPPEVFAEFLRVEMARNARIAKAAGIEPK